MFLRPFFAWLALGFVGVVATAYSFDLQILRDNPELSNFGDTTLRLIVVLQPAMLLALSVALGVSLDRKTELRSWLSERMRGQTLPFPSPVLPIASGFALGCACALGDTAFFTWYNGAGTPSVQPNFTALLYGGLTEELLLRYGLLTLLFWASAKLLRRSLAPRTAWILVTFVAVIFGALHLPVMATLMTLTPALILRTILLNAALGVLVGWLYWRRKLESAMMAHMAFHPGLWAGLWLIS